MKIIPVLFLLCLWIPCKTVHVESDGQLSMFNNYTFHVSKADIPPAINADWNKKIWKTTKPLKLENFMGDKPVHFPETWVKLRYDKENIYLIFKVRDNYVKAVEKEINGKVWLDSCVEFFFSPGPDTDRGYFNLEANCKGVFLFEYHLNNGQLKGFVSLEDCKRVEISHSLKTNVEKEIAGPLEWIIEYRIPFSILKKYMKVEEPGPGVSWRANFYKCADETSHPHWLTWAPVNYPRPKFHLPEYFGRLDFE